MRIAIAGASGLVGRALVRHWERAGTAVVRLVRREVEAEDEVSWDPADGRIDVGQLATCDAVVNLAGENIAEGRWTVARKKVLRSSRLDSSRLLAETIVGGAWRPRVWINASAVGIYGSRGDEWLDEGSVAGTGFLAELCRDWEAATGPAAVAGVRVVNLRLGVVLSPEGGALAKMLPWFRRGAGGPVGDGQMWVSWIALDELVRVVETALSDPALVGPVNAVSPQPVRQGEFAAALGRVLDRPARIRTPGTMLRLLFGEMGAATLLASQRVRPAVLARCGFPFAPGALEPVLRALLRSESGGASRP
jgi:uncharacterized protein (TIGR01777 family)